MITCGVHEKWRTCSGSDAEENQSMARVSVFRQTFGESVREIVMRRALNETYGSGGNIGLDVVHLNVNVLVPVSLSRKERSGDARRVVLV
jgi:hypothetical protein